MSLARLLALLPIIALIGCGSGSSGQRASAHPSAPAQQQGSAATTSRSRPSTLLIPSGRGHLAAMASARGLTLRNRPGGKVVAHLRPTTEWGSPTVVWAAEQRGRWLGVISAAVGNNRIAWLDARRDHPRMWRSQLTLHANLSARTLELRRGARVLHKMSIGIGSPSTPTPTGRFSVTDKLIPARDLAFYGCCMLALSGRQSHLRPGWAGGDRIAIHGGSVGGAASAGCIHAGDTDLRRLMKVVPIGTPVYITA